MSSRISRIFPIDLPLVSMRFHSISFFCICANMGFGQTSSMVQPIVTTKVARWIISGVTSFGGLLEISIPFSFMASTTTGFNRVAGDVPPLADFMPYFSANACAIWERPAFSTQTNKISLSNSTSSRDDYFAPPELGAPLVDTHSPSLANFYPFGVHSCYGNGSNRRSRPSFEPQREAHKEEL